jgi:hypothetical protein
MTRDEAAAVLEQAKENRRKLEACPGPHVFDDATPDRKVGKTYRCSICGGTADAVARHWYELGRAHGRLPEPPGVVWLVLAQFVGTIGGKPRQVAHVDMKIPADHLSEEDTAWLLGQRKIARIRATPP